MTRTRPKLIRYFSAPALMALATACSSAPKQQDNGPTPVPHQEDSRVGDEVSELKAQVRDLTARIETLDVKMAGLNEKMNATQVSMNNLLLTHPPKVQPVTQASNQLRGVPVTAEGSSSDPAVGFVTDDSIQQYRDSMIMFESGKYPEAILEFSTFLKQYPDHPLAGSAQYFVGESYFRQKEHKLALEEFKRVLISYDRSSHLPETLRRMMESEEALSRKQEAGRHRHMLLSLFPHSPAAQGLSRETETGGNARPEDAPAGVDPASVVPDGMEPPTNSMAPMTAPFPGSEDENETT